MSTEPELPKGHKAWIAWLLAAIAGAFLGWFAHLWIHRAVHAVL